MMNPLHPWQCSAHPLANASKRLFRIGFLARLIRHVDNDVPAAGHSHGAAANDREAVCGFCRVWLPKE